MEAISFVNTGVTTVGCKKTVFNAKKWPPNKAKLQLPRMILRPMKKMLQLPKMVHGVGKKIGGSRKNHGCQVLEKYVTASGKYVATIGK